MAQTIEAIKGGGRSITVGATGTIASLMSRELETMKNQPQQSISSSGRSPTVPVSVPCGTIRKKTPPRRNSPNEASSSNSNKKFPVNAQKTISSLQKYDHLVPMLSSPTVPRERSFSTEKQDKKGHYVVDVVDINCGNTNKAWSSTVTTHLKKLSFSKLSETASSPPDSLHPFSSSCN